VVVESGMPARPLTRVELVVISGNSLIGSARISSGT
jgi:hypothetical protein